MKATQKRQLNLIDPFFTEELDYKNDYVSYIEVGGNSSVTPKSNNSEKPLKNRKFKIAKDKNHLNIDCRLAVGLTWSDDTIDKAFSKYKKTFSECVIVEVIPQPHNNALSLV